MSFDYKYLEFTQKGLEDTIDELEDKKQTLLIKDSYLPSKERQKEIQTQIDQIDKELLRVKDILEDLKIEWNLD